jgi:hypothetical protein
LVEVGLKDAREWLMASNGHCCNLIPRQKQGVETTSQAVFYLGILFVQGEFPAVRAYVQEYFHRNPQAGDLYKIDLDFQFEK